MIGLPFISELFTSVLEASKTIEGRLIYCAKQGAEVNMDDFNTVIDQSFEVGSRKIYPVALMMPPISRGFFTEEEWEGYQFTLFFLTSSFYNTETGTVDPNPDTLTSTHTVINDQHDCGRMARDFIRVLDDLARSRGLIRTSFRLGQKSPRMITPVAYIGADRLAGVRLDFDATVYNGCLLEDYTEDGIDAIKIPQEDSHPAHN